MDSKNGQHEPLKTPPDDASAAYPPDEAPDNTMGTWFAKNGMTFFFLIVAIGLLQYYVQPNWWTILKVLMGLSLVVFLHELGHHLAAKWCDVHVTAFSIGFGPTIPGCWFKWGETTYKFALFPLGGYVQMVGQVDGEEGSDGSEDDPRSFRNKSVSARMLIISAGVIMNVILALFCFILVYSIPGRSREAAIVMATDTGSPGFTEGFHTGSVITQIDDRVNPYFDDLKFRVITTAQGETVHIKTDRDPQGRDIEPRKTKADSNPLIGIRPAYVLRFPPKEYTPHLKAPVEPNTPAGDAGFQFGDVIVATSARRDKLDELVKLPDDPRNKEKPQPDVFEFLRRMQDLAGENVKVEVLRGGSSVVLDLKPAFRSALGVRMKMWKITTLRKGSPAAEAGIVASELAGDRIDKVEVVDAAGKTLVYGSKETPLDPERLPHQLRVWARDLKAADKKDATVTLHLKRDGGKQQQDVVVPLVWDYDWTYDQCVAMSSYSPIAIPELGLGYQISSIVEAVHRPEDNSPNFVADNPLQAGDQIKNFRVTVRGDDGKEETSKWLKKDLEENHWASVVYSLFMRPSSFAKIELKVNRANNPEPIDVVLKPAEDRSTPLVERGLLLPSDRRIQKADSTWHAIQIGFTDTYRNIILVFMNLRQFITGRISVQAHLGGPILIAQAAYSIAGIGFWEFVFFLGMISVNLAVINFLPIPVLDGGHMVFLIYEKLRGKPANESVRVGATFAGLAMILSLMVFVFYLDISRLFRD